MLKVARGLCCKAPSRAGLVCAVRPILPIRQNVLLSRRLPIGGHLRQPTLSLPSARNTLALRPALSGLSPFETTRWFRSISSPLRSSAPSEPDPTQPPSNESQPPIPDSAAQEVGRQVLTVFGYTVIGGVVGLLSSSAAYQYLLPSIQSIGDPFSFNIWAAVVAGMAGSAMGSALFRSDRKRVFSWLSFNIFTGIGASFAFLLLGPGTCLTAALLALPFFLLGTRAGLSLSTRPALSRAIFFTVVGAFLACGLGFKFVFGYLMSKSPLLLPSLLLTASTMLVARDTGEEISERSQAVLSQTMYPGMAVKPFNPPSSAVSLGLDFFFVWGSCSFLLTMLGV